ncbi:MAG: hypothetical protein RJA22_2135 [Verrucomicrobiota bacterium]
MTPPESTLPAARTCRQCGRPLPADELEGACPACLWAWFNPAGSTPPDPAATPTVEATGPRPRILLELPGHEVLEEIARGGMGIVYRARQLQPRREVALKMLLPHQMGSPDVAQRFDLEARALADLEHPAILPVYQSGTHDGMPFFTMKLAQGGTLADRRVKLAGQWTAIAGLLIQVADAVHFAHEHGVLHRDLKPGNILFDEHDHVYVSDFGLAKLLGTNSSITRSIDLLGTPHYMAPEVAEGSARLATIPSDIYSLGAVLFELLAGRPPFEAEGVPALLRKIVEDTPAWPAAAARLVPRDLQVICLKCLAKDPAHRYPSARALAEDLQRFLDGEPILARPISTATRAARWCRKNPVLASISASLVLALVGGMLGIHYQWRKARRLAAAEAAQRSRAEGETRVTRASLYAADLQAAHQALGRGDLGAARNLLAAHRPRQGQEDLRGFEWRLLWSLSRGDHTRLLQGHTGAVTAVAFTPDQKTVVSASLDGTVRLWDAQSGQTRAVLPAHPLGVLCASLSPDGSLLATSSFEGDVQLWRTHDLQPVRSFPGGWARVAFHPSAPLLAIATETRSPGPAGQVTLWDYQSGKRRLELPTGGGRVVFSPDGRWLATGGDSGREDDRLTVWDLTSGTVRQTFPLQRVEYLAFTGDSARLLACRRTSGVTQCDLASGKATTLEPGETSITSTLAFAPAGRQLAAGGFDAGVRLLDPSLQPVPSPTLRGHTREILALAFAPNGRLLASGSLDMTVRLWDLRALDQSPRRLEDIGATPRFAPDSRLLAYRIGETVRLWDAARAIEAARFPVRQPLGFIDGGATFVGAVRSPDAIQFWQVAEPRLLRSVPLQPAPKEPGGINASPDCSLVYMREQDGAVGVWDTRTGHKTCDVRGSWRTSNAADFTSDNRLIAVGIEDGEVVLWDLAANRLHHRFQAHPNHVGRLDFSADNRLLATAGGEGLIRVWDTTRWTMVAALPGHRSAVWDVSFAPDGRTLASTSYGQVFLWHLPTARQLFTLVEEGGDKSIRFSPDGRTLVAEMRDQSKTALVWRADPLEVCDAELNELGEPPPFQLPPRPALTPP